MPLPIIATPIDILMLLEREMRLRRRRGVAVSPQKWRSLPSRIKPARASLLCRLHPHWFVEFEALVGRGQRPWDHSDCGIVDGELWGADQAVRNGRREVGWREKHRRPLESASRRQSIEAQLPRLGPYKCMNRAKLYKFPKGQCPIRIVLFYCTECILYFRGSKEHFHSFNNCFTSHLPYSCCHSIVEKFGTIHYSSKTTSIRLKALPGGC